MKDFDVIKWIEDKDAEDMRSLLKEKWGRRFVWRFLSKAGVFSQSFNADASIMAFNEGRRSIGLTLLSQVMEINPEAYLQMAKSNKKEEEYVRQCTRPDPE